MVTLNRAFNGKLIERKVEKLKCQNIRLIQGEDYTNNYELISFNQMHNVIFSHFCTPTV